MTLTAIVWLAAFLSLTVLTFRRSSWGAALYLLTYFAHPPNWWWGQGILTSSGIRWNLAAALIFAVGVLLDNRPKPSGQDNTSGWVLRLMTLYVINACLVHSLAANNVERSYDGLCLMAKQAGLFLLIWSSLRDEFDLRIFIHSIIIGSMYVGYEVVFNERGHFAGSRLEGIGIPGASESNYLASLLSLAVPLAGGLFLVGKNLERALCFASLPLILEVILRCNSRAAFLGLLAGAAWLIVRAQGRIRKFALIGVALGSLAAYMMIGDQRIIERFMSTFAAAEERDASAESRLNYWQAAMQMIQEHPFGSGAEAAFKSELGRQYIIPLGETTQRAVHNGYLDIAAGWGVQGLVLFLAAIYIARRGARSTSLLARSHQLEHVAFIGVCIDAALVTQLITCFFISSLDGEWFFWWIALGLSYRRIYQFGVSNVEEALAAAEQSDQPADEDPLGDPGAPALEPA